MKWTQEELEKLYTEVNKRAAGDPAFYEKVVKDPKAAMEETAGCALPDDMGLKYIEKDNSFGKTYVVPDFAEGEIDLAEMKTAAGGISNGNSECGAYQGQSSQKNNIAIALIVSICGAAIQAGPDIGACGAAACPAEACLAQACFMNLCAANACAGDTKVFSGCGANTCGAKADIEDRCELYACGADACVANTCGADVCGAEAGVVEECGAKASGVSAQGVELCGANACGGNVCGGDACVADACGAEACGGDACGADAVNLGVCAVEADVIKVCAAEEALEEFHGASELSDVCLTEFMN